MSLRIAATAGEVDAGLAVARRAERAAKAEKIRLERQEARHVRRLQPAGEADEQTALLRGASRRRRARECRHAKAAGRRLVGRIEHHAGKAGFGERRDQAKRSGSRSANRQATSRVAAAASVNASMTASCFSLGREEADLDVIDAGCRDLLDRGEGSARAPSPDRRSRRSSGGAGRSAATSPSMRAIGSDAERAGRGILHVDDVGAAGDGDLRLLRAGDAGEHRRHCDASLGRMRCSSSQSRPRIHDLSLLPRMSALKAATSLAASHVAGENAHVQDQFRDLVDHAGEREVGADRLRQRSVASAAGLKVGMARLFLHRPDVDDLEKIALVEALPQPLRQHDDARALRLGGRHAGRSVDQLEIEDRRLQRLGAGARRAPSEDGDRRQSDELFRSCANVSRCVAAGKARRR